MDIDTTDLRDCAHAGTLGGICQYTPPDAETGCAAEICPDCLTACQQCRAVLCPAHETQIDDRSYCPAHAGSAAATKLLNTLFDR